MSQQLARTIGVACACASLAAMVGCGTGNADARALAGFARDTVLAVLRDPGSARFDTITVHRWTAHDWPGGDTTLIVACGRVNAKNGYGGYTGRKRFLVMGRDLLYESPEEDRSVLDSMWKSICRPDNRLAVLQPT